MSEINENNKCVYVHKDKEGAVIYVGSGTISRAKSTGYNTGRGKKYEDYLLIHGKPIVEIVKEGLSVDSAQRLEKELYFKYKETILNARVPTSITPMNKHMFLDLLYYDPTSPSGLRWKVDRLSGRGSKCLNKGAKAGSLNKNSGYYATKVNGVVYRNHRIIAVLHDMIIDGLVVDHIDGNKTNNKIENLRAVSQHVNCHNSKMPKNNKTGVVGVSWHANILCWQVSWSENKEPKLKYFNPKKYGSVEDAFKVACEYRVKMVEEHYSKYRKD